MRFACSSAGPFANLVPCEAPSSGGAFDDRAACRGHVFSFWQEANRLRSRTVRLGKDRDFSTSWQSGPMPKSLSTIGCGERGNEMTDVLLEFSGTGRPSFRASSDEAHGTHRQHIDTCPWRPERRVSIYGNHDCGVFFRDMGYSVALMADSTSPLGGSSPGNLRATRGNAPGRRDNPAYLGTRLASFYERAGTCICHGSDGREGAVSVIGAVSPPGGDLSEPVTQNTLRVTKVFWGLDAALAYQRHFPAINWLTSYSLYAATLGAYRDAIYDEEWSVFSYRGNGPLLEGRGQASGDRSPCGHRLPLEGGAHGPRNGKVHSRGFSAPDAFTRSIPTPPWQAVQNAPQHLEFHHMSMESAFPRGSFEDDP